VLGYGKKTYQKIMLNKDRNRASVTKNNVIARFVSLILTIVAGFILVPMYIKYLPNDIYGYWLASGYFLVLIVSFDPGLTIVVQQRVAFTYAKREFNELVRVINSALILSLFLVFIILSFGFLIKGYIPEWVGVNVAESRVYLEKNLMYAFFGTALSFFSFTISAINSGLLSSIGVNFITIIVNLISSLISGLMLFKGFGLLSITIPMIFSGVFFVILQTTYLFFRLKHENIKFSIDLSNSSYLIKSLSLTFIGRMSSILSSNLDTIIVCKFVSPLTLVIYTISKKMFDYSKEVINQIIVAISPSLAGLTANKDKGINTIIFVRISRILLLLLIMIAGGLLIFNQSFVTLWIGKSQFIGSKINNYIVLSFIVLVIYNSLQIIINSFGLFREYSYANLIQGLLLIFFLFMGSKYMGIIGAILAPIFSIICGPIIIYMSGLKKILQINKSFIRDNYLDFIFLIILVFIYYNLIGNNLYTNWINLTTNVLLYVFLFITFSIIISKKNKIEFLYILKLFFGK
jgi:O-antigen/teichoic acid export membrane protein